MLCVHPKIGSNSKTDGCGEHGFLRLVPSPFRSSGERRVARHPDYPTVRSLARIVCEASVKAIHGLHDSRSAREHGRKM